MKFDPIEEKEGWLRNNKAMLSYELNTSYDATKPMGNYAYHSLGSILSTWLVGLQDELSPLLQKALLWLHKAIEQDERFDEDQNFHRMKLHAAKAMGMWMDLGWTDEGAWEMARIFKEASWRFEKRPVPMNEIIKYSLDDYMAYTYQSSEEETAAEAGVQMYERLVGEKPLSLKKTLKPREFGYALCLHRLRGQFEQEELFQAGRKMLQANLEENWLGGGQYLRAAMWLKVVYALQEQELTPLQTVLKAYENMPNVPVPGFVDLSLK